MSASPGLFSISWRRLHWPCGSLWSSQSWSAFDQTSLIWLFQWPYTVVSILRFREVPVYWKQGIEVKALPLLNSLFHRVQFLALSSLVSLLMAFVLKPQQNLNIMSKWCNGNDLSLNVSRCSLLNCHRIISFMIFPCANERNILTKLLRTWVWYLIEHWHLFHILQHLLLGVIDMLVLLYEMEESFLLLHC